MNKGEYGQTIRANLGEDISSATEYKIILEPQSGDKLEKTATLGTSNVTEGDETYLANEYVEYVIESGVLDYSGLWRVKGEATISGTSKKIGNYKRFTVLP